jgi:hypothetical protein
VLPIVATESLTASESVDVRLPDEATYTNGRFVVELLPQCVKALHFIAQIERAASSSPVSSPISALVSAVDSQLSYIVLLSFQALVNVIAALAPPVGVVHKPVYSFPASISASVAPSTYVYEA